MMTTVLDTLPVLDDDPFSAEILAEPHDFQARLREAGPLVRLSRYDVLAVGRYAEAYATLTDWQRCISSAGVGLADFRREEPWRPPSLLLEADPPRHDAPRTVLTKVLSARAVRRLREKWQADAAAVVDRVLAADGQLDGVADLAEAFPLRVFPDAVGLQPEGREHLLPYGSFAFNAFGPRNELVARGAETVGPHVAWVMEQTARDRLAPGGFGAQIWEAADRGDITPEQAPLMVRSLLTAGVDTTVNGIAATLYALASNPDEYARLRTDPGLLRVAFEEAVRWESPVQTFFRTTVQPVPLGGAEVPADQKMLIFLGSANRDPRHWADPDRYDLGRDPSGHVGFGMGIHQCAGQHVARMEAEILLGEIARRVERIELVGPPERRLNNTLRSWLHLPLRLVAA